MQNMPMRDTRETLTVFSMTSALNTSLCIPAGLCLTTSYAKKITSLSEMPAQQIRWRTLFLDMCSEYLTLTRAEKVLGLRSSPCYEPCPST